MEMHEVSCVYMAKGMSSDSCMNSKWNVKSDYNKCHVTVYLAQGRRWLSRLMKGKSVLAVV